MHDLRWIRENPDAFDRGLVRRGLPARAEEVLAIDREWRALETEAQESQATRNRLSREIGAAKSRGEPIDELLRQVEGRKQAEAVFGTGQLPKQAEDMFRTTDDTGGLWLIPTAEVPLTNLVAGEILEETALPLRFTAWTPCFRSEAGAAGRDTRGMIRMHQFSKVELVSVTTPEQSAAEHERMTECAEEVLKRLGLAYRVMLLSAGDKGCAGESALRRDVW